MFESYSVAVKVALHDQVTAGLMGMSATFKKLGIDADLYNEKLKAIKKTAFIGAGLAGAGALGIGLFAKMAKPAEEYAHILNVMNIQGMTHLNIAKAIGAAWQTTNSVITSTVNQNLKNFIDLKGIFRGNVGEAISFLPEFAKLSAVLGASSNHGGASGHDLAYSAAKALDIRGAVNPVEFKKEADMMAKVMIATQGRVLPSDYQMAFKYGRQSTFGLSNEFLYEQLPTLMLEMKNAGGGSGSHGGIGTSLAAGYRFMVQGIMTKASYEALNNLGLEGGKYNSHLKTTTTRTILKNGVKGAELFQLNPFEWTQQYLLPALHKKYGDNISKQDMIKDINQLRMSQTGSFALLQYALKANQIYGDQKLIQRAHGLNSAYAMSLSGDPHTVMTAMSAQWDNFKIAFMMGVVPVILPTLMGITEGFRSLAQTLIAHKTLAKVLALGFFSLFSAMTLCGTMLIGAAASRSLVIGFRVLGLAMSGLAFNPVVLGLIGIGAALAGLYEIVKHWSSIVNFFKDPHGAAKASEVQSFSDFYHATTRTQAPQVHHHYLDGKQIASSTVSHMAKSASRQPAHGSSVNPSLSLVPNMMNGWA